VVVGILWAGLRAYWGYGVRDVGLYIDPLTDTERYLRAAVGRIPLLLLGQWSPIPAEFVVVTPPRLLWGVAAALLGTLLFAMAPLLRRDRRARFWALGMLLATVPVSATVPGDRLLTFAGIGAAGLLAQFWAFVFGARDAPARAWWRFPAQGVAWYLVVVHAVIAPIALPLRAGNPLGLWWVEQRLYVRTDREAPLEGRTVVIVNAPSPPGLGESFLCGFHKSFHNSHITKITDLANPCNNRACEVAIFPSGEGGTLRRRYSVAKSRTIIRTARCTKSKRGQNLHNLARSTRLSLVPDDFSLAVHQLCTSRAPR
jgi:hypothetical protein